MDSMKLEDCCEILDSQRVPITGSDRTSGDYPYYGANGIQDYVDDFIFDDELVLLAEDGGNFGSKTRPIAYRVSGKCWVNNHAHVLKPKAGLDVDYLCYSLMFYDVGGMVNGATRQKLTQAAMRQMIIPKRSLDEQIEIVNIIKKVQGVIASPRPIEQFLGGDVPWIKIGDATDGDSIYLNSTKEHIIQEGIKKSRLVKEGSLIFANCGVSLGFARIITFDGCIHDGWLAMEDIDERLDKVFLLQALNQMTEHFRAIAPAGTQPNLNTAIMKAYKQVIPPIELQREFINFAKQVTKSKVAVQKALDETQILFDSLMQEYFG